MILAVRDVWISMIRLAFGGSVAKRAFDIGIRIDHIMRSIKD